MATSARFGQVNLYCTWTPLAGSLSRDELATKDSLTGEDAAPSSGDVTPSGRSFEVYAYPLALVLGEAAWIAAKPTDGKDAFALEDIPAIVQRLLLGAWRAIPIGAPTYFVLHVGKFEPIGRARRGGRKEGLIGPSLIDNGTYRTLIAVLEATIASVRARMRAYAVDATAESSRVGITRETRGRLYFDHYSPSEERRGCLVLDPCISMTVDTGQEDAYLLLRLAQQAMLTIDGIASSSYNTLVSRVIAWDANGDTRATLKDLEQIERNARIATVGEVALSLSLAVVSGLLAVLLVQDLVPGQLGYPMGIFGLAALAYGLYASLSWRWVSIIGLVLVGTGLLLTVAILAVPHFASLLPIPV